MAKRLLLCVVAALVAAGMSSCESSRSATRTTASERKADERTLESAVRGPSRNLSEDEAAGGHVLGKHVGRNDDELRARLAEERHISAASTYTDRATAEQVVGAAISASQERIQHWLNRSGRRPNLVLDYDGSQPIGRTLSRGDSQSRPCSHAVVVLKYAAPSYYVLTSYPECRS